jgi:hypothetical protein
VTVDSEGAASDVEVGAKGTGPKAIAEKGDGSPVPEVGVAAAVLIVNEVAAEDGGDTQGTEEAGRDGGGKDLFGRADPGECDVVVVVGGEFFEGVVGSADVPEVGFAERGDIDAAREAGFGEFETRCESRNGRGFRRMDSKTLKMIMLADMPTVRIATTEEPEAGLRRRAGKDLAMLKFKGAM